MHRRSEDDVFFKAVCEALPQALVVVDDAGRMIYASKAFAEILGEEDAGAFLARIWPQLDGEDDEITEQEVMLADQGALCRSFLVDVRALGLEAGFRLMTLGEIPVSRSRLQRLETENGLYARASRVGRIGAWEIDFETDRVVWSEEVYRIHEVDISYIPTSENVFDFFIQEDRQKLRRGFSRALQTGKRFIIDLRLHTPRKNYYWVRVVGKAELTDGKAVRATGIIEDITLSKYQQIDLTGQLQRKAAELHQKNRFLEKTKELLVDSEKKYRRLADAAPLAIALINATDFLYTNPRWQEFTGHTMTAGHRVDRFIGKHPSLSGLLHNTTGRQESGHGRLHEANLYLQGESGNGRWVDFSTVPTIYRGQQAMLMFAYDISDKRRNELELKYSHERFRYIVKHDPNAIAVFDGEMRYLFVSDRYLSDYNVREDDIIGCSHYAVFPEVPDRWKRIHRQVLSGTVRRCEEDRFPRQDGTLDYIRWECRPWYERKGVIGGMVMYTEVITERKQAEIALRHNEARLRHLMDSTVEAIVGLDAEGICVFINRSGLDLLGYDDDSEVIGRKMHDLCHHSHADGSPYPIAECPLATALANNRSMTASDMTFWRKDKTSFPVSLRMQAVSGEGLPQGGVLTFLDISAQIKASHEKKRLEEQLQQSQKMEAIGTLAGGIAHDFNNILGAIIGYAELAELFGTESGDEAKKRFALIAKAAYRARDLVNQILTFSRKEDGDFEAVHCFAVVDEVFALMRASLPATVEMKKSFETEDDSIYGSRTQLVRMLVNLCTNAADAMRGKGGTLKIRVGETGEPPAGETDVAAERPHSWLFMEVSDSGSGFPPERVERLFEPYFTTKKPGEGTGMGLAIVYGIVTAHRGHITVSSEEGKGSVFKIFLPRAAELPSQPALSVKDSSANDFSAGGGAILLVDDEADLLLPAGEALERLGYSVTATVSATRALDLVRAHPRRYDLLITDQTMPQMTGTELVERVHAVDPGISVILCTGNRHMVSLEQLEKVNIAEILGKPVRLATLIAAVERTVKKHT